MKFPSNEGICQFTISDIRQTIHSLKQHIFRGPAEIKSILLINFIGIIYMKELVLELKDETKVLKSWPLKRNQY